MKRLRLLVAAMAWAACAVHAAPLSSTAATVASPAATAGSFFQVLLGLIVVLALLAVVAWSLKRFNLGRVAGNAPVKIVGGVAVGNRERVIVVEVADQWIVVGVAAGQVRALSTLPRPPAAPLTPSEQTPAANNFAAWLKQKTDKRNAQ